MVSKHEGGFELYAICHMCKDSVCMEKVHERWVNKSEFLKMLREANWTIGELVLCPTCNGKGEPE